MEIFLPTLHTFENNNIFTGSCGLLRFRIAPTVVMATPKEVDLAASRHAAVAGGEYRAKGYLKRSGAAALRSGPIFPERIL